MTTFVPAPPVRFMGRPVTWTRRVGGRHVGRRVDLVEVARRIRGLTTLVGIAPPLVHDTTSSGAHQARRRVFIQGERDELSLERPAGVLRARRRSEGTR